MIKSKSVGRNNNAKKAVNKAKALKEDKIQDKEDWLDEHGNPSFDFLQSLADSGSLEKLKSIASDLDAEYSPGATAEELIGVIRAATRSNPNTTT